MTPLPPLVPSGPSRKITQDSGMWARRCRLYLRRISEVSRGRETTMGTRNASAIEGLEGRLIVPGDSEYDEARLVWNGRFDKHPAMIARVVGTRDVVCAVEFARTSRMPLSVRGGSYNVAGK